jgi:ferritin
MINTQVQSAINEQIKNELYSGYLYLAMAAYLDSADWPGMAHWMEKQAGEELEHALKLYAYVNERGGRVELFGIDQPPRDFDSPLDIFEKAYAHEQHVTQLIHSLYEVAVAEKDYATQSMLKWFIDEQVEEEDNASSIVAQLKQAGERGSALLMLDRQLGER